MCRRSTRLYIHHLDFQDNKFIYVFFIVKKMAFVCEIQRTPLWKMIFSQCSTPFLGMRFWRHVPNSLRNKNMERHIPYLF
jgi:hypothetical protein